jgi:hypothetical protein
MKALTFTLELLVRLISAIVLLCVTGFCAFGFLDSFEVGWFSGWHCFYGLCGMATLAGAIHLLLRPTLARTMAALALFVVSMISILWLMKPYCMRIHFPWQVLGAVALGGGLLTAAVALLRRRGDGSKPLGALALFAVTTFCLLGFMETYLRSPWPWQAGYGAFFCGSLTGAVALLRPRVPSNKTSVNKS